MDLFGDDEISSKTTTRPKMQSSSATKSMAPDMSPFVTPISSTHESTDKALLPLTEREKEFLIFSLFGIVCLMTICFILCLIRVRTRKRTNGIDMERMNAGSSTTIFDTKNE